MNIICMKFMISCLINHMKLYATTTSERASKGQGGNDYLKIIIRNEKQQCFAYFTIKDGEIDASITSDIWFKFDRPITIGTNDDNIKQTKGKSQKGKTNDEIVEPWDINQADNEPHWK